MMLGLRTDWVRGVVPVLVVLVPTAPLPAGRGMGDMPLSSEECSIPHITEAATGGAEYCNQ
jgi:hypothetical protein